MRRAVQKSDRPLGDLDDIIQPAKSKSAAVFSTNKPRKIKNLERGIRLCRLRESESKEEISRTRSVSPTSPVEVIWPSKKFNKIYSKIVSQMEMVKNFSSNKTNETENLLDLRRQLQRADEFSIRFSRNNLYETKRIINDIKKLFVPHPFDKSENCTTFFKKIILAFQAASQALQSYINYVRNPSNLEVPDKINELVIIIADLILYCEQIPLPPENDKIKNNAVRICNELMVIFKSKIPVCEYVEFKEADLRKKRNKIVTEDVEKAKKFSMYQPKMVPKLKAELPRKKTPNCFLSGKVKNLRNDKAAMITHEIYTQKLNPWEGNGFNESKIVKFKQSEEKIENQPEKKPSLRRHRNPTPREVRSQDDDVETMVQTIGDDETISKISSSPREAEGEKTDFKELLLQAVEKLKTGDKTEQKLTLDNLLSSFNKFSNTPANDRVKVFHFLSEDLLKEMQRKETEPEPEPEPKPEPEIDTAEKQTVNTATEEGKEIPQENSPKGRFMQLFKPLKPNHKCVSGEVASKGKFELKLSEEAMNNANKYKKSFTEYRKNNIMYKRTLTHSPWDLVGKVSDRIIYDLIKEISEDFQNDSMLKGLYLSELLEVTS